MLDRSGPCKQRYIPNVIAQFWCMIGPMEPTAILERMSDPSAPMPRARDLAVIYSHLLASISDRLDASEMESFIAVGVAIQRSARPFPVEIRVES